MLALVLALQAATSSPVDLSAVKTAAVSAAVAAAPQPCATVPAPDTLTGTVGSGCYAPGNAARPTAVQRAVVTTDATGAWSLTWAKSFAVAPALSLKPIMSGTTKGDCGVSSSTATGATGTCWTYQTTVVTLLGASVSPIATAAAGVQVMVVGGAPTQ